MTRDEISERMGWATVVVGMNDRKFPFAAYTDYPIIELGDKPWQKAPMRECRVLGYDGNKYCRVVVEGVELEIKSGYVYEGKGELLPGCRGGGEMTRDDIIRMAREAHRRLVTEDYPGHTGQLDPWTMTLLARFAALVAAAEREECAALCERFANRMMSAEECADAIRAGSEP